MTDEEQLDLIHQQLKQYIEAYVDQADEQQQKLACRYIEAYKMKLVSREFLIKELIGIGLNVLDIVEYLEKNNI